jgi:hypothetical protein
MGRVKYLLNIVFLHIDVRIISFPLIIIVSFMILLMSNTVNLRHNMLILHHKIVIHIIMLTDMLVLNTIYSYQF